MAGICNLHVPVVMWRQIIQLMEALCQIHRTHTHTQSTHIFTRTQSTCTHTLLACSNSMAWYSIDAERETGNWCLLFWKNRGYPKTPETQALPTCWLS